MRYSIPMLLAAATCLAGSARAQYKMELTGAPPAEVPAPFAGLLRKEGIKVLAPNGTALCELWFRSEAPAGARNTEEAVAIPTIPQGALLGVIRFPARGADRRGQSLKPGVYTLRYSLYPVNGDHQGVAPQRDFLLLTPADADTDPASTPNFETLVKMSLKASGTPHPAVLSLAKSGHDKFPDLAKEGDTDWVVHAKIGDVPVALIVVGRTE